MAIHRLQQGQEPIAPREDLGYGANYLWMLTGEEFDKDLGRAVEQYQITTIDHGFNASTFTVPGDLLVGRRRRRRRRRRHGRAVGPAARRRAVTRAGAARGDRHGRQRPART